MGTLIKSTVLFSFVLVCIACDSDTAKAGPSDSASVAGYELSISTDNGQCVLHYKKNGNTVNTPLAPKPPCYFARKKDNSVKFFAYSDVNVAATLIVIGTPASADKRARWNLPEDLQCGEQNQGVIIKETSVSVSKRVGDELFCRDRGVDEKNFWAYAHE